MERCNTMVKGDGMMRAKVKVKVKDEDDGDM
jgi:hypothetical protein